MHRQLLSEYAHTPSELPLVPDDGWFLANVCHHLVSAGRLQDMLALLADPGWLARKLAVTGPPGVVADFRM